MNSPIVSSSYNKLDQRDYAFLSLMLGAILICAVAYKQKISSRVGVMPTPNIQKPEAVADVKPSSNTLAVPAPSKLSKPNKK